MAKSFDELVLRTTSERTRKKAVKRTQQLLGELLLRKTRERSGKNQKEIARALGIQPPAAT